MPGLKELKVPFWLSCRLKLYAQCHCMLPVAAAYVTASINDFAVYRHLLLVAKHFSEPSCYVRPLPLVCLVCHFMPLVEACCAPELLFSRRCQISTSHAGF